MTTQTLYNQLLNEEITKEQFMYTVRRDERLSQWITNLTSYQDTIKILKNKGAITENVDINKHLSNSGLTSAEKADISKKIKEMGLTGEGEIKKAIGDFINVKVKNNLSKGFIKENENIELHITSNVDALINQMIKQGKSKDEIVKAIADMMDKAFDDIDTEKEKLNENDSEDELYDLISRYVEDPDDAEAELDKFLMNGIDGVSDYVAANLDRDEDFLGSKWNKMKEDINELSLSNILFEAKKKAKKKNKLKGGKGDKLTADQVNPHELSAGIRVEMEHTLDVNLAKEIALDHLSEDPNYYTHLKAMEGTYNKKAIKDKKKNRTDLMTMLDDKMSNVVDKGNGMRYVSDKVEKTNFKDTLGKKETNKKISSKIKEMPVAPKSSKGVKKMALPGKEKRIKLSEILKENIQDRADAINDFARLVKSGNVEEIDNFYSDVNKDYPYNKNEVHITYKEMNRILKKYGKYDAVIKNIEDYDMGPEDDFDPAGGRGLSSHLEENKDSYNKEKINDFISNVTAGYGWATDDYVTELGDSDGLNNNEQYIAMLKLASSGNLYDASQLNDKDQDKRPTSGKVNQKWVEDNYGEMSNIKVKSKIRENESTSLSELESLLDSHDWYFDFSDDHSIYKRGREESIKIKSLVDKLGDKGKELYNIYAYKNKQTPIKEAFTPDTEEAPVNDKLVKAVDANEKPKYSSGEKKFGDVPTEFKLKLTNKYIQSYFESPEKIFSIIKELSWYQNQFEGEKKKGNTEIQGKNVDEIIAEYKKAIEFIKQQSNKKPIKENNSLKYSEELANEYGTQEYINKNSIEYNEDEDGGWSIEFNMLIPFEDVPEFDYPEEASKYFKKQYNINNYSGSHYSKGGVYETNKTNNGWLVQMQFEGGYDI